MFLKKEGALAQVTLHVGSKDMGFAALPTVRIVKTVLARSPWKLILGEAKSIWRVEKEAAPITRAQFQFLGASEV